MQKTQDANKKRRITQRAKSAIYKESFFVAAVLAFQLYFVMLLLYGCEIQQTQFQLKSSWFL